MGRLLLSILFCSLPQKRLKILCVNFEKYFFLCSAHERAHMMSEQRAEGLRWPWERVLNVGLDEVMEVNQESSNEETAFTNLDLYKKFK